MREKKFSPEDVVKILRACNNTALTVDERCAGCPDAFPQCLDRHSELLAADTIEELLAQLRWIPVTERLPAPEARVLVMAECRTDKGTYNVVTTGMHEDGAVWSKDSSWQWEDDFLNACNAEYDEDRDDWKVPEGWYEYCVYNEDGRQGAIDNFVTHWKPMPKGPEVEE